jgi:hypothetical protein
MQSELQKRLFADDSQNDFEVQGPIQAISAVGVQSVASGSASMLNEPAGKRPKVEDLTALLLGLQQSMHDQSLGIVSAIRTATEAGQACVLIAERMQQGFASFAAALAAAVVAPSTPSVAVINQSQVQPVLLHLVASFLMSSRSILSNQWVPSKSKF